MITRLPPHRPLPYTVEVCQEDPSAPPRAYVAHQGKEIECLGNSPTSLQRAIMLCEELNKSTVPAELTEYQIFRELNTPLRARLWLKKVVVDGIHTVNITRLHGKTRYTRIIVPGLRI